MTEIWQGFIRAVELIAALDPEVIEIAAGSLRISLTSTLLASFICLPLWGYSLPPVRRQERDAKGGNAMVSHSNLVKKIILSVLAAMLIVGLSGGLVGYARPVLRLATTTSLYDTDLWEYLEQIFEERYEIDLHVIYAGTGKALEWGRRGDVDIIVIHSPPREKDFVAQGYGVERVPFAYNYFLIVGPAVDSAAIAGLSPQEAFTRLFEFGEGRFVSRGDDSGTHSKEKLIWEEAGLDYEAVRIAAWYIEAGGGMGATLMMASEKQAYTLTDMGTFLAFQGKLDLVPLVVEGAILLNVYSAIAISPQRHPETKIEAANKMIAFLTSPEIQERIGAFGIEEHGKQLFTPCAGVAPCVEEEAQQ